MKSHAKPVKDLERDWAEGEVAEEGEEAEPIRGRVGRAGRKIYYPVGFSYLLPSGAPPNRVALL